MDRPSRILITGAGGMLGRTLSRWIEERGTPVLKHSFTSGEGDVVADLAHPEEAFSILKDLNPEVIVNLVGSTDVDRCEREPSLAFEVNVRTVETIAAFFREHRMDGRLIHISTDQVYDSPGRNSEEQVKICNTYGLSKYAGELAALHALPHRVVILRTNFFGPSEHPTKGSFSDWVVGSLKDEKPITLFNDVFFNPLSMDTLSSMILRVIQTPGPSGVFNLGAQGGMSKRDFALRLANRLGLSTERVVDGSVADLNLSARRSNHMIVESAKFEDEFAVLLPSLTDEIDNLRY